MPAFYKTVEAGHRFESACRDVLRKYTRHVHWGTRIDTAYTQSGFTEVDILAAIVDVVLVVEVKNISRISGDLSSTHWELTGAIAGEPYRALNIFTQNRIHARSLKNAWWERRGEVVPTLPLVLVPDECVMPAEIEDAGVFYYSQLDSQLQKLTEEWSGPPKYGYSLDYLVPLDNFHLERDSWRSRSWGRKP